MSATYGSRLADLWSGADQAEVRAYWGVKLAGFAAMPEAIKAALDALDNRPNPPDLPAFLAMCRQEASRLESMRPRLPAPPPISREEQARLAEKVAKAVVRGRDFDALAWARNPANTLVMARVVELAKDRRDCRFADILADLKARGVCDERGMLVT